ncbi:unnamed protein product, partial [Nesidiocoris tenuis]
MRFPRPPIESLRTLTLIERFCGIRSCIFVKNFSREAIPVRGLWTRKVSLQTVR